MTLSFFKTLHLRLGQDVADLEVSYILFQKLLNETFQTFLN